MGFYGGQQQVDPREYDPLYSQSGAQPLRKGIFDALPDMLKSSTDAGYRAAGAANAAAGSLAPAMQYGQRVLAGNYLSSPQLQGYLQATRAASDAGFGATRAASNVAAQNARNTAQAGLRAQQADTRAQFSRSGQTFGTGNQLAQEGAQAALQAQLGRNESERQAGIVASDAQRQAGLAQNENAVKGQQFSQERAFQQQAPGMIAQTAGQGVNFLQAVPGLHYSGIEPAVGIIRNLAGGGQVVNPNSYYKPGVGDYAMQGLGVAGAAGLL